MAGHLPVSFDATGQQPKRHSVAYTHGRKRGTVGEGQQQLFPHTHGQADTGIKARARRKRGLLKQVMTAEDRWCALNWFCHFLHANKLAMLPKVGSWNFPKNFMKP